MSKVHLNIGMGFPACGVERRARSWSCVITTSYSKDVVNCARCKATKMFGRSA